MAKQVFDLHAGKGMSAGQSTEHLRNYKVVDPDYKKYGYYDPTRVNLNFEVGRGGVIKPVNKQYSIVQRFKDNLRNRGIEDPNEIKRKKGLEPNRNTVANIILGGSRDQMHKLAFGDQQIDLAKGADNRHVIRHPEIEKWAQDMYNYIARRFGEENIIAFIIHLDEKNPHIHCTLVPVNEKNKISFRDVFGDSKKAKDVFKRLHDEVAEINKQYGLERGTDINTTGAKHRTSEEYWQWLKDRCSEMENNLQGKKEELDFLDKEYRRTDIKVKGLSKMLENMKVSRNDIQEEIRQLEGDIKEGRSNSDDIRQQIQQFNKELEDVDKKIKDSFNANVNIGIRQICEKVLKLKKEDYYSGYTFRHTWATVAQNECDATLAEVDFGLNHAHKTQLARTYVKIDFTPAWELNEKVVEKIFFTEDKTSANKNEESESNLFRFSAKQLIKGTLYFKGKILASVEDIGFNNIEEVISHLMKNLPDTIPSRSMVLIRIENRDKGQKQDFTKLIR